MKKILFLLLMVVSITTMSAQVSTSSLKENGAQVEWVRTVDNTELHKQNFKRTWFYDSPQYTISFKFDEGAVWNFDVYEKFVTDEGVYLLGKGSTGLYCIYVTGNEIQIPVYNKSLVIMSKKFASYLIKETETVPDSHDFRMV